MIPSLKQANQKNKSNFYNSTVSNKSPVMILTINTENSLRKVQSLGLQAATNFAASNISCRPLLESHVLVEDELNSAGWALGMLRILSSTGSKLCPQLPGQICFHHLLRSSFFISLNGSAYSCLCCFQGKGEEINQEIPKHSKSIEQNQIITAIITLKIHQDLQIIWVKHFICDCKSCHLVLSP